jgi:Transcription factor Iwr1
VRATFPGAEIKEEAERRAAQTVLRDRYSTEKDGPKPEKPALDDVQKAPLAQISSQNRKLNASLRRFHLHHGPKASHHKHQAGIHKRKTARRNHLATFVERAKVSRRRSDLLDDLAARPSTTTFRDSILKESPGTQLLEESRSAAARRINKTGQSMLDHPSTWDYDSDQLAEELAAFAREISQDDNQNTRDNTIAKTQNVGLTDTSMSEEDDFIYETYIRVPLGDGITATESRNNVGLLVIDDEDQELWQTYIEIDDDSEWDEEDPDSNGMCSFWRLGKVANIVQRRTILPTNILTTKLTLKMSTGMVHTKTGSSRPMTRSTT